MKKKKDYSGAIFLIIFACLLGWVCSILLIERSNQKIIKEIDRVSVRISRVEEMLKERFKPPSKLEKEEAFSSKPPKEIPPKPPKEIPPKIEIPPLKPSIPKGSSCKIAIILDDGGYGLSDDALSLIKTGFPITISIIPNLSYSKKTAEIVYKNKGEVMVHLPMEARKDGKDKGVISSYTDKEKIKEITKEAISDIPYCVGVNNHKGSKATADKAIMEPVFEVIRENNLYFVDSLTTPKSIAYKLAIKMEIPSSKRDIFIDNNDDPSYVLSYFYELIKVARKNGSAIGIGHIYKKATIAVLKEQLPNLEKEGIELVHVSDIVK